MTSIDHKWLTTNRGTSCILSGVITVLSRTNVDGTWLFSLVLPFSCSFTSSFFTYFLITSLPFAIEKYLRYNVLAMKLSAEHWVTWECKYVNLQGRFLAPLTTQSPGINIIGRRWVFISEPQKKSPSLLSRIYVHFTLELSIWGLELFTG